MTNLSGTLAAIDEATAPMCTMCPAPLDASPSDDFCGERCQRAWHQTRADAEAVRTTQVPDGDPTWRDRRRAALDAQLRHTARVGGYTIPARSAGTGWFSIALDRASEDLAREFDRRLDEQVRALNAPLAAVAAASAYEDEIHRTGFAPDVLESIARQMRGYSAGPVVIDEVTGGVSVTITADASRFEDAMAGLAARARRLVRDFSMFGRAGEWP